MGHSGGGAGIAKAVPAGGGPAATATGTAGKLAGGQGERLLGTTFREMTGGPHRPINPTSVEDLLDTLVAGGIGAGAVGTAYGLAAIAGERLTGNRNAELDNRTSRRIYAELNEKASGGGLAHDGRSRRARGAPQAVRGQVALHHARVAGQGSLQPHVQRVRSDDLGSAFGC